MGYCGVLCGVQPAACELELWQIKMAQNNNLWSRCALILPDKVYRKRKEIRPTSSQIIGVFVFVNLKSLETFGVLITIHWRSWLNVSMWEQNDLVLSILAQIFVITINILQSTENSAHSGRKKNKTKQALLRIKPGKSKIQEWKSREFIRGWECWPEVLNFHSLSNIFSSIFLLA